MPSSVFSNNIQGALFYSIFSITNTIIKQGFVTLCRDGISIQIKKIEFLKCYLNIS